MTRTEFVRAYARRSGASEQWAVLGLIEYEGGRVRIALPCACDEEGCEGWAMLSAEGVDHHLQFDAPASLRDAYRAALAEAVPAG
jgi:hypothetical protein